MVGMPLDLRLQLHALGDLGLEFGVGAGKLSSAIGYALLQAGIQLVELLFYLLACSYVKHNALEKQGLAIQVAHDHRLVIEPDHPPVTRQHAKFRTDWCIGSMRAR